MSRKSSRPGTSDSDRPSQRGLNEVPVLGFRQRASTVDGPRHSAMTLKLVQGEANDVSFAAH